MPATATRRDTPTAILDTAERLVQQRGFNGFSYADVAAELGLTKAGLHYHFAGKAELGEALMNRYTNRFGEALAQIDAGERPAPEKLDAYIDLYADVLSDERMCLCGMLAAEYRTLPERMQAVVLRFFDENERWLERVLEDGRRAGTISVTGSARDAARLIVSALEGAMLVARPYADVERFRAASRALLAGFVGSAI
jgi:TetR/AcrR family transcriptional repressor of nem operon